MNYKRIHDLIIFSAKSRTLCESTYYEKHHILPKCEGGLQEGETVSLSVQEHRIIHLLRWKMTGVVQNYYAYCLMTSDKRGQLFSIAGKMSHTKFRERDPKGYRNRQSVAGISGGINARDNAKGFFSLSDEEKTAARNKGRKTLVEGKIGMFSDEYRILHAKNLRKKVLTPDGIYDSMIETANHYGICPASVTYRCNSVSEKFCGWKIIEIEGEANVANG